MREIWGRSLVFEHNRNVDVFAEDLIYVNVG